MSEQKPTIYTLATAHLDTSWLWDLETTIEKYIPLTLHKNFALFERFPDYVFNFEGSYRYELMEEYYPQLFEKLHKYVESGNWVPVGSAYENGDVNTPSPEALFRNILYGNDYFRKQFGKPSNDIYLPDCFGFGWALPSIAAHANLHGFTTQKLTWNSAYGTPFKLGKWYGVDGSFVYANLRPGPYGTSFKEIRNNPRYRDTLNENMAKFDLPFAAALHGIGDRGGAPSTRSVKAVMTEAAQNGENAIQVVSTDLTKLFADMRALDEARQEKLPTWNNELLLTAHGVGSYTSRTVGKRWNRRSEQLADAAERSACAATWLTGAAYPKKEMERAWKRVIAHQFHDDITGTSFQRCYQRNWNDYVQSMNQFAEEYRAGCEKVSLLLDSSFAQGTAIVVNNPLQGLRSETVTAKIAWPHKATQVYVADAEGREVPAQILQIADGIAEIAFAASVPSVGYAVYDARPAAIPFAGANALRVTARELENEKLRVSITADGAIGSILDKQSGRELLSAPIRFTVIGDRLSKTWPAWEVQYEDVQRREKQIPRLVRSRIAAQGAARVAIELQLELVQDGRKSTFIQLLSLDAGADVLRVENEVDWYCAASMLKVEFPLSAANPKATYDIGLGTIQRENNTEKMYEVPAQLWADITNEDGRFGASIFSDSRAGWDKPDDNTLRLTAIHTPLSSYRWECAQHIMDMGLNRFGYGIFAHSGDWQNGTQTAAARFQQPMNCFETTAHPGVLGGTYSFAALSDESVLLRCVKQAENSEEWVVRFQEGSGNGAQAVHFRMADGIQSAREIFADEEPLGDATLADGELVFDLTLYQPRSFALTLNPAVAAELDGMQTALDLEYNVTAITNNCERSKASTPANLSFPRENMPDIIRSGGISFSICKEMRNAATCGGQKLALPQGGRVLHLLACAMGMDQDAEIAFNGKAQPFTVQCCTEAVGAWDLPGLGVTGYIKPDTLAFTATHAHSAIADRVAKQLYLFKYSFAIPEGCTSVTLPNNRNILLFAATATGGDAPFRTASELFDTLEKRPFVEVLSKYEKKYANPTRLERLLNKLVDRDKSIVLDTRWGAMAIQIGDIYYGVRKVLTGSK